MKRFLLIISALLLLPATGVTAIGTSTQASLAAQSYKALAHDKQLSNLLAQVLENKGNAAKAQSLIAKMRTTLKNRPARTDTDIMAKNLEQKEITQLDKLFNKNSKKSTPLKVSATRRKIPISQIAPMVKVPVGQSLSQAPKAK